MPMMDAKPANTIPQASMGDQPAAMPQSSGTSVVISPHSQATNQGAPTVGGAVKHISASAIPMTTVTAMPSRALSPTRVLNGSLAGCSSPPTAPPTREPSSIAMVQRSPSPSPMKPTIIAAGPGPIIPRQVVCRGASPNQRVMGGSPRLSPASPRGGVVTAVVRQPPHASNGAPGPMTATVTATTAMSAGGVPIHRSVSPTEFPRRPFASSATTLSGTNPPATTSAMPHPACTSPPLSVAAVSAVTAGMNAGVGAVRVAPQPVNYAAQATGNLVTPRTRVMMPEPAAQTADSLANNIKALQQTKTAVAAQQALADQEIAQRKENLRRETYQALTQTPRGLAEALKLWPCPANTEADALPASPRGALNTSIGSQSVPNTARSRLGASQDPALPDPQLQQHQYQPHQQQQQQQHHQPQQQQYPQQPQQPPYHAPPPAPQSVLPGPSPPTTTASHQHHQIPKLQIPQGTQAPPVQQQQQPMQQPPMQQTQYTPRQLPQEHLSLSVGEADQPADPRGRSREAESTHAAVNSATKRAFEVVQEHMMASNTSAVDAGSGATTDNNAHNHQMELVMSTTNHVVTNEELSNTGSARPVKPHRSKESTNSSAHPRTARASNNTSPLRSARGPQQKHAVPSTYAPSPPRTRAPSPNRSPSPPVKRLDLREVQAEQARCRQTLDSCVQALSPHGFRELKQMSKLPPVVATVLEVH